MKKIICLVLLSIGVAFSISAKKERLVTLNPTNEQYGPQFWIDREDQKFYYDSDSEDDATMLMKNYVKKGNKESFDIYLACQPDTKFGHVVLVIDPTLKVVKDKKVQTMKVTDNYYKQDFLVLTEEQEKATMGKSTSMGSSNSASSPAEAVENPEATITDKAKDKAKGLLNKGKKLFKKK